MLFRKTFKVRLEIIHMHFQLSQLIAEGDGIAMVTTPGSAPWLNFLAQLLGSASWLNSRLSYLVTKSAKSANAPSWDPHTVCVCGVCVCVCVCVCVRYTVT